MDIDIPNKKLKKILMGENNLKKVYNVIYKRIQMRINLLQTVENLSMVPVDKPERCHLLEGNYKGCYAVCIDEKMRIIIKPRGYEMPYNKNIIKNIDIVDIINYHN